MADESMAEDGPAPDAEAPQPEVPPRADAPEADGPQDDAEVAPEPELSVPAGRTKRYVAGLLSALIPGAGHLVLGRRLLAGVFFAPILVLAGAIVVLLLTNDRAGLAARLVDPAVLAGFLVLQLGILAWRLVALGSSLAIARPPRYGAVDVLPVALLAGLVILPQAYLGTVTNIARQTALEVFQPADAGPVWHPSASPSTTPTTLPSGVTPAPGASAPSPTPAIHRLTVLLIGEDSGVGRQTALTDTMIVASLDPIGKTVSMLSIPRDLVDAPIPGGGVWHEKINSLAAYARHHPETFPGSNGDGQAVLAGTISELIGVPIDYWAQVNLGGLIRIVDTVDGVDVAVAHGFCDPGYDEYGQQGFGIPAGRWHLSGSQALAYARVRKASGESDFTRAARQQEILVGLRDALVRGGFLGDPIGFLEAIGQTLRTNVPPSVLPDAARFASEIGRDRVFQAVIRYPLVRPTPQPDPRGSIQIPDVAGIRVLAASLFPDPGIEPVVALGAAGGDQSSGGATGGGSGTSPAASPTPTPVVMPTIEPGTTAVPGGRAPNAPRVVCRAPAPTSTPKPSATPAPSPSPSGPEASPVPSGSDEPSGSGEPSPTVGNFPAVTPSPTAGASSDPAAPPSAAP